MSIFAIGFLFLLVVLIFGISLSIRWLLIFDKQIEANRKAGLHVKLELINRIRRLYIVNILIYSIEIGLLGGLLISKLFTIGWFAFGIASLTFGIFHKKMDLNVRRLLTQV